jgi:hypothetical protein
VRGLSFLLGCCGAVVALLGWLALVPLFPPDPAASSMAVRLGTACAALLPGCAVLALMIIAQMGGRFLLGVFDPLAGRETRFLLVNQRILTNTVEQVAVFAPALLALAAAVPAPRMPEVMALGAVFALSRIVFWAGYLAAPVLRAPGMAATIVTATGTLAAAFWFWLT